MNEQTPHIPGVSAAGSGDARPAPALRALRCARHSEREAVGRCPVCGGSFCRECVSEHEGRLLCAQCLAREIAVKAPEARRRDWAGTKRVLLNTTSVLVLWALFFLLGELLVKIPPEYHEGNIWKGSDHAAR